MPDLKLVPAAATTTTAVAATDELEALEDTYDELDEGLDDQEGIFEDEEGIFDSPRDPREAHANLVTNRAQEIEPELLPPGTPVRDASGATNVARRPVRDMKLVAVFGADGRPYVARTINGNQVENFRAPTAAEHEALRQRGQFVRGGLSAAPAAQPEGSGLFSKVLKLGLVAAALGGAFYAYKAYATEDDALDADADDDDVEDE